jgi:hypothetical protein
MKFDWFDFLFQISVTTLIFIMFYIVIYNMNDTATLIEGLKISKKIAPKNVTKAVSNKPPASKPAAAAEVKSVTPAPTKEDTANNNNNDDDDDTDKEEMTPEKEKEILDKFQSTMKDVYKTYFSTLKKTNSEMGEMTIHQLMHDRAINQTNAFFLKQLDEMNDNMDIERLTKI